MADPAARAIAQLYRVPRAAGEAVRRHRAELDALIARAGTLVLSRHRSAPRISESAAPSRTNFAKARFSRLLEDVRVEVVEDVAASL